MNSLEGETTMFDKNTALADTPDGSDTNEDSQNMDDSKPGESSQNLCSKRMLSTEDPDYARPPDCKRMREMERKAQDELSGRVIKVVDKELTYSINEKQNEIEEIDSRILRLQQCLHTLRYCVSLNYYAANKTADVSSSVKNLEIHPSVRRHLGKTPRYSSSSSQVGNSKSPSKSLSAGQSALEEGSTDTAQKTCVSGSVKKELITEPEVNVRDSKEVSQKKSKREIQNDLKSQELKDCFELAKNESPGSSRPPSPKYLPPKPPDNPQTIVQGRHQRFQAKKRVVVGNTYQYLPPHAGSEAGDALRYKWQVYVRAPTQDDDVSSFIAAVTFILDQSYAPHHVINIKHPPFILSRRGWGEFKIQIVLKFADSRNKQVKLLHSLTLNRADDPLALTGLWRLGQENWYDIWIYEQDKTSIQTNAKPPESISEEEEEENCPANLEKELVEGVVSHKIEENTTVVHNLKNSSECKVEETLQAVASKVEGLNKITGVESKSILSQVSSLGSADDSEKPQTSSGMELSKKTEITEQIQNKDVNVAKGSNVNGAQGKVCKIHVRQPDGSLVPYFIPAHMYSLALKIAQTGNKTQGSQESSTDVKQVSPAEKAGHLQGVKASQQTATPKQENEDLLSVKQESKEIVAEQEKTGKIEMQGENGQESAKGSSIPVKIFNISPNKGTIKASQVVMNQLPSSSGSQSIPKLTLTTQGKQTVARVSAGSLSQNALQQLLVKAGLKDKKPTLVKKLLSKANEVHGESVQSVQLQDGQLLSAQSPLVKKSNLQFLPVKIVQDKQPGGSPATKIVKKPISAANIRFVTNNGQLISAGQLAKGITIPVASKASTVASELPGGKCILATSSANTTSTIKDGTSVVMMPGGRIITGSGLQLVTSQGKNVASQNSPLTVYSQAQSGKTLQLPPLIVRGAGSNKTLCTLSNSTAVGNTVKNIAVTGVSLLRGNVVTSVNPANVRTLLKPLCITTTAGVTATTPVFTNISTKVTSVSTTLKSSTVKISNSELDKISGSPLIPEEIVENLNEVQEVNAVKKWEEEVKQLKAICRSCRSLDACINIWIRALPLVSPSKLTSKQIFPFCAGSQEEFKIWPLGKQRAAEFQRAREVKRLINDCEIEGSEWLTTNRIVAWARCHAYTPVQSRPLLQTDKFCISLDQSLLSTATHMGNLEELERISGRSQLDCTGHQELDVVSLTEESDEPSSPHKSSASPRKEQSIFLAWEDQELVGGCEWVGHLSSQLRINQNSEEVLPGFRADAARAIMWKAMLNLMEDLLRSSHCEAWGDSSGESSGSPPLVPPKEITYNHVIKALTTRRQEFELFTNYGLGSIS